MPSLLVVDDDPNILELFKDACQEASIHYIGAESGSDALEAFKKNPCDFVLTDIVMPGGLDGLEVILELKDIHPDLKVFAMTGDASSNEEKGYLDAAAAFGAVGVFQKPFSPGQVIEAIKSY